MPEQRESNPARRPDEKSHQDGDLSDMLGELRVLLPGAQLLTAFMVTLPFSGGFSKVQQAETWVFLAAFISSLSSLVLLSAPAVQHSLLRPLLDRERFKLFATRMTIIGVVPLSLALVLVVELVVSEVFGRFVGVAMAGLVLLLIGIFWWLLPKLIKRTART